jgi:hypothetical protein
MRPHGVNAPVVVTQTIVAVLTVMEVTVDIEDNVVGTVVVLDVVGCRRQKHVQPGKQPAEQFGRQTPP